MRKSEHCSIQFESLMATRDLSSFLRISIVGLPAVSFVAINFVNFFLIMHLKENKLVTCAYSFTEDPIRSNFF